MKGAIRKSNRTDNESAKMATAKGVIQGYTGVAAVDDKHQIIVEAQAHGTGSEQELLLPVVVAMKGVLAQNSLITADAGYHSEENLEQLAALEVEALIADNRMRGRDERFATQDRHREKPDPLSYRTTPQPPTPSWRTKTSVKRSTTDDQLTRWLPVHESGRAGPHQPLTVLDHRSSLSASKVSSTRVEMVHTCPDGSRIRPVRSPQNWFFTGIRTLAPAATARSITVSTSST